MRTRNATIGFSSTSGNALLLHFWCVLRKYRKTLAVATATRQHLDWADWKQQSVSQHSEAECLCSLD